MIPSVTSPQPRLHLMGWQCPSCPEIIEDGHDRLVLVFRSGENYVFTVGESATTLPVRLSSAAISLFKSHGIGADDLARFAAQWARGRHMTCVNLTLTSDDFTELYLALSLYLDSRLHQAP